MSFNIHHGEGTDGVLDLERIANVISSSEADIVGLQEVDKHFRQRSNFEDQAKWLAEKLGMHYVFAANLDQDPYNPGEPRRQYGTAVLSKYPILESHNYFLSSFGQEQRGLLETLINVKGNRIHFYTTHLGTVEQRQTQVEEILEITGKRDGIKIITGDFNSVPTSLPIRTMTSVYKDGFAGTNVYTAPSNKPTSRIDYIFTSADVNLTDPRVVTVNPAASDHLPVIGTIVLKRETPFDNGAAR
jgi:endonuclease/exonuclease/phosphatase family metal-dependent hydrolase